MWWNQDAWEQVNGGGIGSDYDRCWDAFYARFDFRPGTDSSPAIREPKASVTLDLSHIFSSEPSAFVEGAERLGREVLAALQQGCAGQRLAVLDWQHPAYWLQPDRFHPTEPEDWAVPVFPNGDYYVFMTEDLTTGTFGHPWEQTLCGWGEPLLTLAVPVLRQWLPVRRLGGNPA